MTDNSKAAVVARWRKKHPDRARMVGAIQGAQVRAMRRLSARHEQEYEELLAVELAKKGLPRHLPPLPPEKDGRGKAVRSTWTSWT